MLRQNTRKITSSKSKISAKPSKSAANRSHINNRRIVQNLPQKSPSRHMSLRTEPQARSHLRAICQDSLDEMKTAGTLKRELVLTSPQGANVSIETPNAANGHQEQTVLNFCANNYLGLSNHPKVVAAAHQALDNYGAGLSSVRFICGTQTIHRRLEQTISTFHNTEDTILFPSAFDANEGIFEAILTQDDALICDELNHASIINGVRLCKAERHIFKHMDLADLESALQKTQHKRLRMIVTDGVFSMDGHVAPLKEIVRLARQYNALTFVDDAHATGCFGKTGRGTPEYCDVLGEIDIINSTLGKALGGAAGGFTTGSAELVALLRNKARPYLFSNSLAPPIVGAAQAAFDLLLNETTLQETLLANTSLFRTEMKNAGFAIEKGDHPIVPVMLGDAQLASDFAAEMVRRGIYVVAFSYPVVPKNKARIRVQICASHTEEMIRHVVKTFSEVRDLLEHKKAAAAKL